MFYKIVDTIMSNKKIYKVYISMLFNKYLIGS